MRKGTFPVLTAAELAEAGEGLFGADWRAAMAHAFGLRDDALIRAVESGRQEAPAEWRAHLIALAQDVALRAMETASALLWHGREESDSAPDYAAPRLV